MKQSQEPTRQPERGHHRVARKVAVIALGVTTAVAGVGAAGYGAYVGGRAALHAIERETAPVPHRSEAGNVLNGAVILNSGTKVIIGPGPFSRDQSGYAEGTGTLTKTEAVVRPIVTSVNGAEAIEFPLNDGISGIKPYDAGNIDMAYVPLDGQTQETLAPATGLTQLPATLESTPSGSVVVYPGKSAQEAFNGSEYPGLIAGIETPYAEDTLQAFEQRIGENFGYTTRV